MHFDQNRSGDAQRNRRQQLVRDSEERPQRIDPTQRISDALEEEISRFLKDFIFKLEFWGVFIRTDRTDPKNANTLLALELKRIHVKEILRELKVEDYSQGPFPDKLYNNSEMWVFGKIVKKREVYIKIQLGAQGSEVICISFHFPEHPMNYSFKKIIV